MRVTALIPLACAIAAFVLSMLCLFAGSKPAFMEDYHLVTLNTSTLGHNLLNATKTSAPGAQPTSILSWLTSEADNITTTLENDLTAIENDVADELAATLGIKQWYSLHLMDACEGTYAPNATAAGASLNVSSCTNRTAMYHFDPTAIINEELGKTDLHLNISDIAWPSAIQDGINALNTAVDATFILYCLGIGLAGIAIIFSIVAFFLHGSRLVSFVNWAISFLSFLCLAIASIITTVLIVKMANEINQYGNDIGVFAYKGGKFLALTWSATAVMLLATLAWVAEMCVGRRQNKREFTEKPARRNGWNWLR